MGWGAVKQVGTRLSRWRGTGGAERRALARKHHLRWWLVYGPARSGTTFVNRQIAANARVRVGDWGLGHMVQLPPDLPYIRLDRERARRDLSRNILENAASGGGTVLDLVYKSAELSPGEYDGLVAMWGVPERRIFCFREPAGYMASAVRKFPDRSVDDLRDAYVRSFESFETVGGVPFEYRADLTLDDYRRLLAPLPVDEARDFAYQGSTAPELVTPPMVAAYERVVARMRPTAAR